MIVYLESNVLPTLKVWDSTQPPSALGKLLHFGVKVETDSGQLLYQSPNPPTTAPWIQWGLFAAALGGILWVTWRAVR